jgi:hypothetical protein
VGKVGDAKEIYIAIIKLISFISVRPIIEQSTTYVQEQLLALLFQQKDI